MEIYQIEVAYHSKPMETVYLAFDHVPTIESLDDDDVREIFYSRVVNSRWIEEAIDEMEDELREIKREKSQLWACLEILEIQSKIKGSKD